jgi:RNA polymerase sigma factor (sigma-70 family)
MWGAVAKRDRSEAFSRVGGVTELTQRASDTGFAVFVDRTSRSLSRALVAVFGPEIGREAALDALAWGWEHWDRVQRMRNPAGYLYRVGMTAGRRAVRKGRRDDLRADVVPLAAHVDQLADPDLERALAGLSERQRAAVLLVVGHDMTLREASELLGCSVSSLRNHVDRALRRLRAELGDDDADR